MLIAKITAKNVTDYKIVSKLAEYSYDDTVTVDIYHRCCVSVPSTLFIQCLGMLYRTNVEFEVTDYIDTTEED